MVGIWSLVAASYSHPHICRMKFHLCWNKLISLMTHACFLQHEPHTRTLGRCTSCYIAAQVTLIQSLYIILNLHLSRLSFNIKKLDLVSAITFLINQLYSIYAFTNTKLDTHTHTHTMEYNVVVSKLGSQTLSYI